MGCGVTQKKRPSIKDAEPSNFLVGAVGFELTTLCSQSRCATRLRYAPNKPLFYTEKKGLGQPTSSLHLLPDFFEAFDAHRLGGAQLLG